MTIYKTLIISLLFAYEAFAYTNILKFNNKSTKNISSFNKKPEPLHKHLTEVNLNRSNFFKLFTLIPYIPLKYIITKPAFAEVIKEKTIEELRKDAFNIIDIIEVQKSTINLPLLKPDDTKINSNDTDNTDNTNNTNNIYDTNYNVDTKTKIKIDGVLSNIMNDFKIYGIIDPVKSVSNLQKYCSATNIIKHKNTRGLTASFQDGKYSLLLGKFINYEIVNYEKNIDANSDDKNNIYYAVDMKVNAAYKTMLQNSIQFNDMYYPQKRDFNNICYVIYRWSFRKYEDGNLYLEGCFLIPPSQSPQ
jgi:hypothetical protein